MILKSLLTTTVNYIHNNITIMIFNIYFILTLSYLVTLKCWSEDIIQSLNMLLSINIIVH